ncbi:MAG TPA: hypothetical protein VN855_00275 [Candidatus Acidoferrum sp.]|nr:hypothetical protein [Candidatus Acidoferrum sp.]
MSKIKTTKIDDQRESQDVYLHKDGEKGYVGLHSTGYTEADGSWNRMESWANIYGEDKKFQASIFRIFGPLEETVEDMEQEGWVVITDWEQK